MEKLKIILVFIAMFIAVLALTFTTNAHNQHSDIDYNFNNNQWEIYENPREPHWQRHNVPITVNWGDFTTGHAFRTHIDTAVSTWNNATFNNSKLLSVATNTNGSVVFRNRTTAQITAKFGTGYRDAWGIVNFDDARLLPVNGNGNHLHYSTAANSVEVWINWGLLQNQSNNARTWVALHEIGHIIGLKDIPRSIAERGHVMVSGFGNADFLTSPSLADRQGVSVISGQHTTHNFSIQNQTHAVCAICNGYFILPVVVFNQNYINAPAISNARTNVNRRLTSFPNLNNRTGFVFDGWFETATSNTEVTLNKQYEANTTTTIYARWSQIRTVTFAPNGCSRFPVTLSPTSAQTAKNAMLISLPSPTRTGFHFKGWFTTATGNETVTLNRQYSTNTTIHAQWTPRSYSVTLDRMGATIGSTSIATTINSPEIALIVPTRPGYTFTGYFTSAIGGNRVIDSSGRLVANVANYTNESRWWIRTTTSTTLFAQWEINGIHHIQNIGTGLYLDSHGHGVLQNGSPVSLESNFFGDDYQKWNIFFTGGAFNIRNEVVKNLRIANSNNNAILQTLNLNGNIHVFPQSEIGTFMFSLGGNIFLAADNNGQAVWRALGSVPAANYIWRLR
jgi:uncharacterized repeat protein (TIGR02543 family)